MATSTSIIKDNSIRKYKKKELRKFTVFVLSVFSLLLFLNILFFFLKSDSSKSDLGESQNKFIINNRKVMLDTIFFCEKVVNNRPFNKVSVVPVRQRDVYCFSKILILGGYQTDFARNWFKEGKRMVTQKRNLAPGDTIITSRLNLDADASGNWSLDLLLEDNTLLSTADFQVR